MSKDISKIRLNTGIPSMTKMIMLGIMAIAVLSMVFNVRKSTSNTLVVIVTLLFIGFMTARASIGKSRLSRVINQRQKNLTAKTELITHEEDYPYTATIETQPASLQILKSYYTNIIATEREFFGDYIMEVYDNNPAPLQSTDSKQSLEHYELYSIYSITLDSIAPHVFFDSKKAKGDQAKLFFESSQIYKFEGGLDKIFTAYLAPGQAIDALSEITPDVMLMLQATI